MFLFSDDLGASLDRSERQRRFQSIPKSEPEYPIVLKLGYNRSIFSQ